MPMTQQERDELRRKVSALKAAEEVEGMMGLVRETPVSVRRDLILRLTGSGDERRHVSGRNAPNEAMWRGFVLSLVKVLEEYNEKLLAIARGEEEGVERLDAEMGVE